VYDVLKNVLGMSNEEIADIFAEWNKSELESYCVLDRNFRENLPQERR
jgi:6-phosphogluconate dehydrogenase